jgi:hypothetical protein
VAKQQQIAVRVARLPMTSVLRARAIGETRGFMKILLDAKSARILGFTMLGADAGEVLAVVQTAMLGGLPYTVLRDAILTHPTMAERLNVCSRVAFRSRPHEPERSPPSNRALCAVSIGSNATEGSRVRHDRHGGFAASAPARGPHFLLL